jgi:hypothetical protein
MHSPFMTEENPENSQSGLSGTMVEIQTRHIPDTCRNCYPVVET